jgi:hypothetical protein
MKMMIIKMKIKKIIKEKEKLLKIEYLKIIV